jgi:hypothetical protein
MAFPTPDYYLFTDEDKRKLPTSQERGGLVLLKSELTVTAAAVGSGIVSRVLWAPAGFQLWGISIKMGDLDGATSLVWDLGWRATNTAEDDQDGIVAASQIGRSAGMLNTDDMAVAGFGYTFVYDSDIVFTASTASGTPAAAACKFGLIGTMP